MKEILVLCPFGLDSGLVSKAVALSANVPVRVLVPESEQKLASETGARVIHTLSWKVPIGDEALFSEWLAEKIIGWGSEIVLAPATVSMRCIMPMLAWKLDSGLTADCTELALDGDFLLQTRPAFGNSLMATIRTESRIQMATIRPGTFPTKMCRAASVTVIPESDCPVGERVKIIEGICCQEGKPISQADIIVAGGLGVGSKENFKKLEGLAESLGAAVGASRAAVDAGFAPYRYQIGMTGVTVSPKLYIAVGIHGAVQHLAGMSGAEKIVAINSDPRAPIFDYADYGIVGDWEQVIDQLMDRIKEKQK